MAHPERFILPLLALLLLLPAFASGASGDGDAGIEKQLDVLQKIRDYNRTVAESTLRNVTFLIAFLGGVLSFLAPCTVALFPAFLAYTAKAKRNLTLATTVFFAGFSSAFIAIGIALTSLGRISFVAFQQDASLLVRLAGIIIIFLGIMMLAGKGFSFIRLRTALPKDLPGTFIFGALFAVGWSACIGPVIAGIFTMAAIFHNYAYTSLLLFFYALGLALPLFAAAFVYDRFNLSGSRLVRGFSLTIRLGKKQLLLTSTNLISGLLLIFLGMFFIVNGGTTAITSADLLGMILLLLALSVAVVLVHRFIVSRLLASQNARKAAAIIEIAAALAIFGLIAKAYKIRTVGITERLSHAVLQNARAFNFVAAAILVAFGLGMVYFIKRSRRRM